MKKPRIDSITMHYRTEPARKKPQAGDERVIGGVLHVRQQQRVGQGLPGAGAYVVSNGRPVWEWVVKGSEQDRERYSASRRLKP